MVWKIHFASSSILSQIISPFPDAQDGRDSPNWRQPIGQQNYADTEITLTITGINLLPNLVAFRNALKEIPGVMRHQSLEMTPRQTVLSVTYAGTPQELADAVLIRPFEGFGINIEELTDNHLRIMLIPR